MPVLVCFFCSGAAALVLQVLWTRMLGLTFGATALAVSTTLTVFMGGLALGSFMGGRWAPRLKRPLLVFAVLESAVGLYGLLVPGLLDFMPAVQRSLGLSLGFWGWASLRFALVAIILVLPTTAMGATLPILAQGVVERSDHMASRVGRLYAYNTAGAVVGALCAGFWLIPTFGLTNTVYAAAAIDLAVAALVAGIFYVWGSERLLAQGGRESPNEVLSRLEGTPAIEVSPVVKAATLWAFALSGAAAMALQVLWTRAVGVVIGASTYSFTLILVTFLVGLAGGAAWISRKVDRIADPVRTLAWVEVAVGLSALVATALIDRLPLWLHAIALGRGVTTGDLYLANFGLTAVVTLPATIALGMVMPLVVRILTPKGHVEPGPVVGKAYTLNTMGAIVGSFAAGFILLPTIGVEWGLRLAAVANLCTGLALAVVGGVRLRGFAVAAAAALVFGFATPSWDVERWTSGLFRMYLARSVYKTGWQPYGHVVFHRDGIASTVTVERQEDGVGVALKVNGKVDASDIGDMPTQILSGLLPIILHEHPTDVLVIGYGSGVTPGAVLQVSGTKVRVAEIEQAVYEAANKHFTHVNHAPATNPRAELAVDDGRNFLLTRKQTFDVIISEPSNPWMTGAASLFTREFFEIAKARLNEGGVFLQWLQLYELSPENIHALVRTFHKVFPEVLIFSPDPHSNDTFLIGSREPRQLSKDRVASLLADDAVRAELKRAEITSPDDFFGLFLLGTDQIPEFVGPGPINTDDNALIEFAAPRDLLTYATKDARLPFVHAVDGHRLEATAKYFVGFDDGPAALLKRAHRLLRQARLADAREFAHAAEAGGADAARVFRLADYVDEADSQAVVVANDDTIDDELYARAVRQMMLSEDREAVAVFDAVDGIQDRSLAHRFLYAFLCYRRERLLDAVYLLDPVVAEEEFVAAHPEVLYYAGRIAMMRGQYVDGLQILERFDDARQSELMIGEADPLVLEVQAKTSSAAVKP